ATHPRPMLEFLQGKVSDRKLRLFGVACCRRICDSMSQVRSRSLVLVAERFADGLADADELRAAYEEAFAADNDIYVNGGNQYASTAVLGLQQSLGLECVTGEVFNCITICDDRLTTACHDEAKFQELLARLETDEWRAQSQLLRDVFGNPFRPVAAEPSWLTSTVVALAEGIYQERAFDRLPILADALQDAGCDNDDVLTHCRSDGLHIRGCWVVDLLTGRK
ncbi:MAG TPA: hypothetical protein VMZ71_14245, partial [Gemmataceae bacterium]|nr:hypothetical protein [Gemmataceae bacterium]